MRIAALGMWVWVGVVLVFGLASCDANTPLGSANGGRGGGGAGGGGGTGSGSCGEVQPCGGDPTGTWKIATTCATSGSAFSDASCPTATGSMSGLSVTGTYTFNADKTYSMSVSESGTVVATIPASCLAQSGFSLTCAEISAVFLASAGMSDSPFSAVSCAGTSACTCTLTLVPTTMTDSGTWSAAGTSIVVTSSISSESDGGPFCVQGDTIHLLSVDMTMPMGPMGTATITEDVVATRQ